MIKDSLKAREVVSGGEVYTPDFSGFPPHTVQQQAPQVDGRRWIPPGVSRDGLVTPAVPAMPLISTERQLAKKKGWMISHINHWGNKHLGTAGHHMKYGWITWGWGGRLFCVYIPDTIIHKMSGCQMTPPSAPLAIKLHSIITENTCYSSLKHQQNVLKAQSEHGSSVWCYLCYISVLYRCMWVKSKSFLNLF